MTDKYSDQIRRAKLGESDAFGELVHEFQDMAFAVALGWLGEREAAKDVAQDAFLDAFEHLHQLREAAAFPGWFKRILVKHCDRMTRRQSPVAQVDSNQQEGSDDQDGPQGAVEQSQNRKAVRTLVESLPPKERILIALQYFAELTGPQIAELMDLPLTTVKKRLRSARSRLRQLGELSMNKESVTAPSTLTDEVMFFVGLRRRDYQLVTALLAKQPALANATQSWSSQVALDQVLPQPNHATALVVAIELDDLVMLQILLNAGADPDGICGCQTAESPLWAAALFDRPEHAEVLLNAGANPNLASNVGNYPLHIAAMRGNERVAMLLLKHGANSAAPDAGSKWPQPAKGSVRDAAQWAEANGHLDLAQRIRSARNGASPLAVRAVDLMRIHDGIIHTGIKSVDLFAPLPKGKLTRVLFEPNAGVVTLLGELSRRWLDAGLGNVVWTGFAKQPIDRHDWEADLHELGLEGRVELRIGSLDCDDEARVQIFDEALTEAEKQADETLLVVISNPGFEHIVESNYAKISASGSLTSLVVVPKPTSEDTALASPFAAQIRLDPVRVKSLLLPPIDPQWTYSRALDDIDAHRVQLSELARKVIFDYALGDPELDRVFAENGAAPDDRARRLLKYLRQPLFVTEPFTGTVGEFVRASVLIEEITSIVTADIT